MARERKTENILEQLFLEAGFTNKDFQFQGSDDEEIQRCIPSKRSGKEGTGRPEHIIKLNGDAADLLITECKYEIADHASASDIGEGSPLKPSKYAEDGVIHYMKGLRKEFNVIGVAVSGRDEDDLKISTFKVVRGGQIERLSTKKILRREDYLKFLKRTDGYGEKSESEIMSFARELHEFLRDHMELSESCKPLIVSGILLALKDEAFAVSYRETTNKAHLAKNLTNAIENTLEKHEVDKDKIKMMMSGYDFIKTHFAVQDHLKPTIAKIYRHLHETLLPDSSLDVLGNFYGEFLRYSGGDQQGFGIVLTPRHITELFADIADLDPERSVVLDTCSGTGGFLIAAMADMVKKADGDTRTINRIKKKGLLGIELDPHMYTLACANMIFRGDGKANMFHGDCLAIDETSVYEKIKKARPNVAMLNPPYSKKAKGKHELNFVLKAAEMLEPGGICVAIVPVGALIDYSKDAVEIKRKILEKHTLRAVMSMPVQLFPGVGTVTAIMVIETGRAHCKDRDGTPKSETWFGYWVDDGFMLNKNKRIERKPGEWQKIKEEWLDAYRNKRVIAGASCKQSVTHEDEWIAEAYMETDYSTITKEDFERDVKRFALFNLMLEVQSGSPEEYNDAA